MGKEKYLKRIESLFKKSPVVNVDSIKRIIRSKKQIRQYSKQLIRNLILKDKIKKLARGFYTAYDDVSLAVFCFKPSYLGLQDALSIHNLWEQEAIPIIITTRKIRQGIRRIMGVNVWIRRISPKYLFGFDYIKQGDFYYPYSDIEKTFIDMIYFRQAVDKNLVREFKKRMDIKKLKKYARRYPKRTSYRILKLAE